METVPVTTAVKRNRVGNVDTSRLNGRRGYLVDNLRTIARDAPNRIDFLGRVAELVAIEAELIRRGELDRADARTNLMRQDGTLLV